VFSDSTLPRLISTPLHKSAAKASARSEHTHCRTHATIHCNTNSLQNFISKADPQKEKKKKKSPDPCSARTHSDLRENWDWILPRAQTRAPDDCDQSARYIVSFVNEERRARHFVSSQNDAGHAEKFSGNEEILPFGSQNDETSGSFRGIFFPLSLSLARSLSLL